MLPSQYERGAVILEPDEDEIIVDLLQAIHILPEDAGALPLTLTREQVHEGAAKLLNHQKLGATALNVAYALRITSFASQAFETVHPSLSDERVTLPK